MAESDNLYLEIVAELDDVFVELGASFTVETPGVYDNDTQEYGPPTTRQTLGIRAAKEQAVQFGEISVQVVGKANVIFPHTLAPQPGESVVIDGVRWPLTKIEPVKPADIVVLYILDVTE